ncbi:MAG: type-F conjugative transfer system secretin TraK [Succinivibrionaceae bacterium]|nr:type-F conjugative transfer system secretin TraK [Succinivibrionaceae bacterium]
MKPSLKPIAALLLAAASQTAPDFAHDAFADDGADVRAPVKFNLIPAVTVFEEKETSERAVTPPLAGGATVADGTSEIIHSGSSGYSASASDDDGASADGASPSDLRIAGDRRGPRQGMNSAEEATGSSSERERDSRAPTLSADIRARTDRYASARLSGSNDVASSDSMSATSTASSPYSADNGRSYDSSRISADRADGSDPDKKPLRSSSDAGDKSSVAGGSAGQNIAVSRADGVPPASKSGSAAGGSAPADPSQNAGGGKPESASHPAPRGDHAKQVSDSGATFSSSAASGNDGSMRKNSSVSATAGGANAAATSGESDVPARRVVRASDRTAESASSDENRSAAGAGDTQDDGLNRQSVITVRPGINEIIPVSRGFVNRIVTPFAHPEVISSSVFSGADSCEEFCIRGSVIYIAFSDARPVAMFVTEQGRADVSISVTMIPRNIPPREVIFRLPAGDDSRQPPAADQHAARRFEQSGDYISTIKKILKSAALNRVPEGYELRNTADSAGVPSCHQRGLEFSFANPGQMLAGYNFSVYIGVVKNVSDRQIEFDEISCADPDVAAVASWPISLLYPGDRSELFVIRRLYHDRTETEAFRPNLLREGR